MTSLKYWFIKTNYTVYNYLIDKFYLLSAEERLRVRSYVSIDKMHQYFITRVALRLLISLNFGADPQKIVFSKNAFGKLYLKHDKFKSIFFNLSHAKNLSLIAFSDEEIGVDLEFIDTTLDYEDLASKVLSVNELTIINSITDIRKRLEFFYNVWTIKEAYLKAKSTGLINDLDTVCTEKIEYDSATLIQNLRYDDYIAHAVTFQK